MIHKVWLLCSLSFLLAMACTDSRLTQDGIDGGAFVLPDSGYVYDGGTRNTDLGVPDSGPHTCDDECEENEVCACLMSGESNCGCHLPQAYQARCDPQVQESCLSPLECVRGRLTSGYIYLCSDGRAGTPCSKTQDTCTTSNGCVCLSTPFGVTCECQGRTNVDPLFCDPQVPASCPNGTCVRVDSPSGAYYQCSDGTVNQPCERGDGSCVTSLGCTCPIQGSRPMCRCSEPGTEAGDLCDPMVMGSCVEGLNCEVRGNALEEGYISECVPENWMMGGGDMDPFACDPNAPLCPPGFDCEEVMEGVFRCRHR